MEKQKQKITTIKLEEETKLRLDKLREDNQESYNSIIKKMLYVLNSIRKSPELAKNILNSIDKNIKRKQLINKETTKEKLESKKEFKASSESQANLPQQKETH
jgi:hypothetical protein